MGQLYRQQLAMMVPDHPGEGLLEEGELGTHPSFRVAGIYVRFYTLRCNA
jgi:hypothetical protein